MLVLLFLVLDRLAVRAGLAVYWLFSLPGTLAHEAAHYITGLISGTKPSFPSLAPRKAENGRWVLGSVAMRGGNLFSLAVAALAPVVLLPLGLWLVLAVLPSLDFGLEHVLIAWVSACLLTGSIPSSADLRIAAPALVLIGFLVLLSVWLAYR